VPKFIVHGGQPLNGVIRPTGNKNAALPMIAATLLTDEDVFLENVPRIKDVLTLLSLLEVLGAETEWTGPSEVRVRAANVGETQLDAGQARASAHPSSWPAPWWPARAGCSSPRRAAT
jgi:UDP-N-acetylglucosamine 1-carboxyvinyltransferase